ncbi:MAG: class I SAM-dependent methyltransferase [Chloroflexi bacterium]|nr:class I SAM-dependent methyltransferase [Chloroflexota bacterium]MCL5026419.1 class I SAM-dependent methyltransferase [Chloroflexota bacterium]
MKIASHWVHGVLLDAGCGAKPYYSLLRPKLERYIGLDYPPYLESGAQPTQTEVFGDVCRLPFPDSYFDCALCTQVLEHVSEPGMAIAELHRVLAPGGVLILTAPRSEAVHGAPYDFFRYTKYGLWNLLQKDGKFEVERTEYLGFFWADVSRQWDVYAFEHLGGPTLVGFVLRRILLFPALWISIVLVNIVGGIILDRIDKIEASSPNYLVVARKK